MQIGITTTRSNVQFSPRGIRFWETTMPSNCLYHKSVEPQLVEFIWDFFLWKELWRERERLQLKFFSWEREEKGCPQNTREHFHEKPDVRGSNPVIVKCYITYLLSTVLKIRNKRKRGRIGPILTLPLDQIFG